MTSWLDAISRANASKMDPMEAICAACESAFETLHAQGPQAFDFSTIEPALCAALPLCALLRACSNFQNQIPSWDEGVQAAIEACELESIDPRDALLGLL